MEQHSIASIEKEALQAIQDATTTEALTEVRNIYLSKKGVIAGLMGRMKDIAPTEKASYGQLVNNLRDLVTNAFDQKQKAIDLAALQEKLARETIDISLPSVQAEVAGKNPFFIIQDEIEEIFIGMGYQIAEGPEIELDHFNFELLNIAKDHPARDMQDSFYIDENTLLRTHTSPVQARTMQAKNGQPIKVICPGKVYRRDDDDATHSHQFAQVEGLLIDKDINLGHLKATLELFIKKMYGEKREIRLRSSYFPFTEPSVEVDVSCAECGGKGCSVCKGTGWIEILGGGMVHPNVLRMNGYDPKIYQGFAFGIGIERVAMLRYGIEDIRRFYQNDVRFIRQFKKR